MNTNRHSHAAKTAQPANTPFGRMNVPDGGCLVEDLDTESLETILRAAEWNEAHMDELWADALDDPASARIAKRDKTAPR